MGVRRRRSERGTLHRRSEDEATEASHTITCLLLGVGLAWFYKWRNRALGPAVASGLHTRRDRRRNIIDRAGVAIKMAIATRGGIDAVNHSGWRKNETKRVIFHTDRGSTYTANSFTKLCRQLGLQQSMGMGWVVLRQHRRGGVLQQPGAGGPLTPRAREHTRQA